MVRDFHKGTIVITKYAQFCMINNRYEDAHITLKNAIDSDVFSNDPTSKHHLSLLLIAVALISKNHERVSTMTRSFVQDNEYYVDTYRFFTAMNSGFSFII